MKITWLAHAAFLLEGSGIAVITDPYSPEVLGLPRIPYAADVVIRSSSDDQAHCRADLIGGNPATVTATEIVGSPANVRGITIEAMGSRESVASLANPRVNGMYKFQLDGIVVAHFGDIGNALEQEQIDFLRDADVALVPAGGPPTIRLPALFEACRLLAFPLIIPMHYRIPGARPRMLPVTDFTSLFEPGQIEWSDSSTARIEREALPASIRLLVLNPAMCEASAATHTAPPAG